MKNEKLKVPQKVTGKSKRLNTSLMRRGILTHDSSTAPSVPVDVMLSGNSKTSAGRKAAKQPNSLIASNSVAAPASITELARALKHNVDLIHEWVYSNVDFYPIHGLHKGDYGTLNDRVGGSFDQAKLMVSLLRESGYTATYVLGRIRLFKTDVDNFFGTQSATSPDVVTNLLNWAQIPYSGALDGSGQINYIDLAHLWVKVNIDGTDYMFDPAFKKYVYQDGISDIGSVIAFDESTLISAAESGATITADSIQDLNRANIRDKFKEYGTNLLDWIRENAFDASMAEIIGGRKIDPSLANPVHSTTHPRQSPAFPTNTEFDEIPDTLRAKLNINFGFSRDFFSDEIYGRRLTITFNSSNQAELRLDGVLKNTTSALSPTTQYAINFTVIHPFSSSFFNAFWSHAIYGNGIYQLGNCWGPTRRAMVDAHSRIMQENIASGGVITDEDVGGESLAALWFSHQSQAEMVSEINDWLGTTIHFPHHMFGITGQNDFFQTPYLDLGNGSLKFLNRDDPAAAKSSQILTAVQYVYNALEGGIMQQSYQAAGIATPKVLDTAAGSGQKIYDATSANWNPTSGFKVRDQLVNWSNSDKSSIDALISAGNRIIINEDHDTSIDSWVGGGFHSLKNDGVAGVIAGHILGGTLSLPKLEPVKEPPMMIPPEPPKNDDPVGLYAGELTYDRTDFSVGSGGFPYSLDFGRSYNSNSRFTDGPLGKGWTHNHASALSIGSNGFRGLGESSPKEAAAVIAHCYVLSQLALFSGSPPDKPTLTKVLIASLSSLWLIDILTNNTVSLSSYAQSREFVKLVDDTFNPRTSDSHDLIKNVDGTFTLKNRHLQAWNFNVSGKITSFVDPAGMSVSYTYDGNNKLTGVSNGLGRALTFTYTGSRLTSVSDGNDRSISFSVDSSGNLASFTDPLGQTITHEYVQPGLMSKVFLPENPTVPIVTNTFDSQARVMSQTRTDTGTTNYYFAGSRSEGVDALGHPHIMYWNENGSLVKEVNALGQITLYDFDGLDRLIKTTLPEGNSIELEYDNKNNLLTSRLKAKPSAPTSDIINSYTYHSTWNKPLTETDGRGNTTNFTYSSTTGRLLTIERPQIGGQTPTVALTYNARGQLLTRTDETGIVSKMIYDSSTEKLLSTIHDFGSSPHLNLTVSFDYDAVGNVTSITDPRGNTATVSYDDDRKVTQNKTAPVSPLIEGFVTNFAYDQNNRLTSTQRETGNTLNPWQTFSRAYTPAGDLASATDPTGNVRDYTQDQLSRLSKMTDAEGRSFEFSYDELDRVSSAQDPELNTAVTRGYTTNGKSAFLRDALYNNIAHNSTTSYEYDGFDRLVKTTYPGSTSEQLTYDDNSNVLTITNRAGQVITMTYDALNRQITKSPQGLPTQTMSYDLAGRLKKVSTPAVTGDPTSGDFEFFYDSAGRLYQQKSPDGKTLTFDLDENGNKTRLTYPDGYFVDYSFDEINRLTDIKLNGASTAAAHFDYNPLSQRTKLTYGNGCMTDYSYENNYDLNSLVHTFANSSVTYSYTFDRIHQVKDQEVSDPLFMFDPVASLTTNYAAVNTLNQYPTVGGTAIEYNDNGCMTSDGTWTFSYDSLNRMTGATITGASVSFLYDPLNRQIEKNVGGVKKHFLHDGIQLIADYDSSGSLLNRFVYGPGMDEPLIQITSGGTLTYYHQDRQSSLIASTDASGNVVTRNSYGPFGETDSSLSVPVGYTGQRFDSETGLYNYKSRYYSPVLGRFLQPDPIGYAGTLNLYAYTANSPISLRDPLGLSPNGPSQGKTNEGSTNETFRMLNPPSLGEVPTDPKALPPKGDKDCGKGGSGAAGGMKDKLEKLDDLAGKILDLLDAIFGDGLDKLQDPQFAAELAMALSAWSGNPEGAITLEGIYALRISKLAAEAGPEAMTAMQSVLKALEGRPGTYRFPDNWKWFRGRNYVGRSDTNVSDRLRFWISVGRLNPNDAGAVSFHPAPWMENTFLHWDGGPRSSNVMTNASNAIWGKGANKVR